MSASLRFVTILLAFGVAGAFASGVVQYREYIEQGRRSAEVMSGGSVDAGNIAIERHGCGSCHIIPGIAAAAGRVGPSLRGVARRAFIAGKLQNGPQALALWVRFPRHVSPDTAMPEQPMSDRDARDIAAYLLTQRE